MHVAAFVRAICSKVRFFRFARAGCWAAILAALAGGSVVQAQTANWIAGDSSWFIGTNWDTGSVPTSGTVEIGNAGTVHISGNGASAGIVRVGAPITWENHRLIVENAGVLTLIDFFSTLSVGRNSPAELTVTGVGSQVHFNVNGELLIGTSASGSVTVADGGAINSPDLNVGVGDYGSLTITGEDSYVSAYDEVFIGKYAGGAGVVNLEDSGTLILTDPNVLLEIGSVEGSTGAFNLSGAEFHCVRATVLGVDGGAGSVNITGPSSSWTNDNFFIVGNAGHGGVSVSGGGALSVTEILSIADDEGSSGEVTISGLDSTLSLSASHQI
ncbi:MAG: hypothetical protein FLDDKLPJ_02669 [Phycisphaerae bacterium]|nr:hypothetical protein [Phycisphaerae bacterium]